MAVTVEIGLGYRFNPQLSIGAYGGLATYALGSSMDRGSHVLGATAGLQAVWHFQPARSFDPWLGLGAGWKALATSVSDGPDLSVQGIDLARVQDGVDFRISKSVAIAPVIGAAISTFVSERQMDGGFTDISEKRLQFTGFLGLAGRFDLGGTR